jgi:hypothetical protein
MNQYNSLNYSIKIVVKNRKKPNIEFAIIRYYIIKIIITTGGEAPLNERKTLENGDK